MLLVYILTGFLFLKYLLDYIHIALPSKLWPNTKAEDSRETPSEFLSKHELKLIAERNRIFKIFIFVIKKNSFYSLKWFTIALCSVMPTADSYNWCLLSPDCRLFSWTSFSLVVCSSDVNAFHHISMYILLSCPYAISLRRAVVAELGRCRCCSGVI